MAYRAMSMLVLSSILSEVTANGQVLLQEKMREGSRVRISRLVTVDTSMLVETVGARASIHERSDITEAVGAKRTDCTIPIDLILNFTEWKMSIPVAGRPPEDGLEIKVDSQLKDVHISDSSYEYFRDMYRALGSWRYTVVLDPSRRVTRVEGMERNFSRQSRLSPEALARLRERFRTKRVEDDYRRGHAGLPKGPVRIGDRWEETERIDPGITDLPINLTKRFEYKGSINVGGKVLHRIAVTSIGAGVEIDPDREALYKVTSGSLKVVSSQGELHFDTSLGRVISRDEKTRLSGRLTEVRGHRVRPIMIDIAFVTSTTIKVD